jgi:hypothetical protein
MKMPIKNSEVMEMLVGEAPLAAMIPQHFQAFKENWSGFSSWRSPVDGYLIWRE